MTSGNLYSPLGTIDTLKSTSLTTGSFNVASIIATGLIYTNSTLSVDGLATLSSISLSNNLNFTDTLTKNGVLYADQIGLRYAANNSDQTILFNNGV